MTDQIKVTDVHTRERNPVGYSNREYMSKARIYVHPEGESIFQNLCFRHDRPYKIYRQALPQALEALGLPANTKCRWSQKAGCSCGCSPGFIVDAPNSDNLDCWVTIEGVEQPVTDRALDRAAQVMSDPTLAGPLGVA